MKPLLTMLSSGEIGWESQLLRERKYAWITDDNSVVWLTHQQAFDRGLVDIVRPDQDQLFSKVEN